MYNERDMANEAEENLTFHSPSAMMAVWIDTLGQITGHDQEKVLLTLDFNKEHKLEHIKATDPGESWEKHFKRKRE